MSEQALIQIYNESVDLMDELSIERGDPTDIVAAFVGVETFKKLTPTNSFNNIFATTAIISDHESYFLLEKWGLDTNIMIYSPVVSFGVEIPLVADMSVPEGKARIRVISQYDSV